MKFYSIPKFFNDEELEQINSIIDEGEWSIAASSTQLERKTKIKWINKSHSFLFDKVLLVRNSSVSMFIYIYHLDNLYNLLSK